MSLPFPDPQPPTPSPGDGLLNPNNPAYNPSIAGRRNRCVTRTSACYPVRLDADAIRAMHELRDALTNPNDPTDRPSCSLLCRAALKAYAEIVKKQPEIVRHHERWTVNRSSELLDKRRLQYPSLRSKRKAPVT